MDMIQKFEDDYLKMYSTGGKVERSFWQNVGKTAFPEEIYFKGMKSYDDMMGRVEEIINGKGRR